METTTFFNRLLLFISLFMFFYIIVLVKQNHEQKEQIERLTRINQSMVNHIREAELAKYLYENNLGRVK